jgi:transposase
MDVPLDGRQRSEAEKARIAAESLLPGVAVADVARKHRVTRWRLWLAAAAEG